MISVSLGNDNRLVLIGEGTDVIKLTTLLRKKLGYADVISVTSADQEYSRENGNWGNTNTNTNTSSTQFQRDYYPNYQYYAYPLPPYNNRFIEYG